MTGNPRIVSLEAGTADSNDILVLDHPVEEEAEWEAVGEPVQWDEPEPLAPNNWAVPIFAVVVALGWSGFFVFANWAAIRAGAPRRNGRSGWRRGRCR